MKRNESQLDRRQFIGLTAAAGAGALIGADTATAAESAAAPTPAGAPRGLAFGGRVESRVLDCEVIGKVPAAVTGSFYRVGPDYQYPPNPKNVPFDGDGHMSAFHLSPDRVDYLDRFVETQRFKAQDAAGKALFGVYRNPYSDDPSVAKVSRGTANTHVMFHHGKLMALKEDSPPVVIDTKTLQTTDDYYTFKSKLPSQTFTAHPKIDPVSGEMIAFGYEGKGFGTDDISVFAIDKAGHITWNAWVKVPYVSMIHDFSVTQKYIIFYVMPMALAMEQMKQGGVHWAWDSSLPTYFGVLRRGGDGKDVRWFKGPERCATHVMSGFNDGDRVYVDVPMAMRNQFAFFPHAHEKFDAQLAQTTMTRLSVDMSKKSARGYQMEELYPGITGELPRIDERYLTQPYKSGFLMVSDPSKPRNARLPPGRMSNCYVRMEHDTRKTSTFFVGDDASLSECVFAPRNASAPEGDGYLMGIATRPLEGGRTDLVIVDTAHMEAGPVATVKLPLRAPGQIHGWWSPAADLGHTV